MRFRVRDYAAEAESCQLPRFPALHHPLPIPCSPPPVPSPPPPPPPGQIGESSSAAHPIAQSPLHESDREEIEKANALDDPLRHPLRDAFASKHENVAEYVSEGSTYSEAVKVVKKEWITLKRCLLQKSSISKIPIRLMPDVIQRISKGRSLRTMHLEEIEDPQKASEEELEYVTHQQYVSRLNELKDEISKAWQADDRVTALKLSIKVGKLLMDTSGLSFYPTLFMLVTDVLDTLGDLVWERIKRKAEYDDDGNFLASLPERFDAVHVRTEARDTCRNWFAKIGGVRELLPRIYLELAILHCRLFLEGNLISNVERLTMMIRGVADPLASAYCRTYMVRCAQALLPSDSGFIITSLNDLCTLMRPIALGNESFYGSSEKRKLVVALLEPTIEWMMKCLFRSASQSEQKLHLITEKFGLPKSISKASNYPCVSMVLYYFLRELPSEAFPLVALDIPDLIEDCKDTSLDQWLNYRLLGSKLCESSHPSDCHYLILEKVFKVACHYDECYEYLEVADVYLDFILQHDMGSHLNMILDEISVRAEKNKFTEKEITCIESIMLKLVNHFTELEDLLALRHFMHILDATYGSACRTICTCILGRVVRISCIQEPAEIQFLFQISRTLYDKMERSSFDNDQYDSLIARFIQLVDFGSDVEEHLNFLIDCRAAFGRTDQLLDTIIHSCNCLAVRAMKVAGNHSVGFVKACLAFTEVTIPAIMDDLRRINLSIETAEIALQHDLLSQTEGLIDVAIGSFDRLDPKSGCCSIFDAERLTSSFQCLCSFLIMVPVVTGDGICSFLRRLMDITNSMLWVTPTLRSRLLFAIVSVAATVSQRRLPYHVISDGIVGDDLLYLGGISFLNKLHEVCDSAVRSILDTIERESNTAARGYIALEACFCLLSAFQVTDVSHICCQLIDIAKSSLPENNSYLQSAVSVLDRHETYF
ncbi:uncharacterized protein LOC116264072 isoform X2 [Nymphaea colorata]|uniref:uncharacterized protein LOC116264072 isoform X2 n=1 Tax=Nymphaea colorata TaxID=210225 RepID=UPI00129EDE4F|nr:uncharacterized protein LOC116264072 isoform X2 [Nymphaea colorata]